MNEKALHKEMKRLRFKEHLTLREVAERTGTSMSTVRYWVDDKAREKKLAQYRNIPLDSRK